MIIIQNVNNISKRIVVVVTNYNREIVKYKIINIINNILLLFIAKSDIKHDISNKI